MSLMLEVHVPMTVIEDKGLLPNTVYIFCTVQAAAEYTLYPSYPSCRASNQELKQHMRYADIPT
jgi:hypothetical protein